MFGTYRIRRHLAVGTVAGAMLISVACASAPPAPTAALDEANLAIQAAAQDDASHYANAELDQARQKLLLANDAVAMQDMVLAGRLANEATVTAELATAKTEAAKAQAINVELNRGALALIEEMQRVGDQQ